MKYSTSDFQCYYAYLDGKFCRDDYERTDFCVERLVVCKQTKEYSYVYGVRDTEVLLVNKKHGQIEAKEVTKQELSLLCAGVEQLGYQKVEFDLSPIDLDGEEYYRGVTEFFSLYNRNGEAEFFLTVDHFLKKFSVERVKSDLEIDLGMDCFGEEMSVRQVSRAVFWAIVEGLPQKGYTCICDESKED